MKMLSYADIYTPFALQLADGRPILLDQLMQSRTFAGLLVGAPDARGMDMLLDAAFRKAKQNFGGDPPPHLIKPALIDYTVEIGHKRVSADLTVTPEDGAIETHRGKRLPLVTCIAQFVSPETICKPQGTGLFEESVATLIWFQEAYGPPADEAIIGRLKKIKWEEIACDVSW